jgi:hypothetical protein
VAERFKTEVNAATYHILSKIKMRKTMKTTFAMLAFLLLGCSQAARGGDLDWLIGCWETPDKSAIEAWVKYENGDLGGFSVTVEGGQVIFHEVLRIVSFADGSATYTAHPVRQPSTTFKAKSVSGTEVTFSNPSHDFPQEVSYRRDGNRLFATISALNGKNPVSFNKRACE